MLRELEDFPFALTEPSFGLRQQLDRVFARHGFEPNTFCVTNSLALVKEVASIGNNCTLLPRFAVERELAAGTIKSAAVRELGAEPLGFFIARSATGRCRPQPRYSWISSSIIAADIAFELRSGAARCGSTAESRRGQVH
ncbi:LysR family transcriptional regulator substrate-binding protein [Bradyrhizobium japonicum]